MGQVAACNDLSVANFGILDRNNKSGKKANEVSLITIAAERKPLLDKGLSQTPLHQWAL